MVREPELPDLEPEERSGTPEGGSLSQWMTVLGGFLGAVGTSSHNTHSRCGAASSAGDGDCPAQGSTHRRLLSQHRLGPGPCKWERQGQGDLGSADKKRKQNTPVLPGPLPLSLPPVTCAVSKEGEKEEGPGHGAGYPWS